MIQLAKYQKGAALIELGLVILLLLASILVIFDVGIQGHMSLKWAKVAQNGLINSVT